MTGIGIGPGLAILGEARGVGLPAYSPLSLSLLTDGVNEACAFQNYPAVDFEYSSPFSLFIWLKVAYGKGGILLSKYQSVPDTRGWMLKIRVGPDHGYLEFYMDCPTKWFAYAADFDLDDGPGGPSLWHMVGALYDGSNAPGGVRLVHNGAVFGGAASGNPMDQTIKTTAELCTQGSWDTLATRLDGVSCHSAVYNRRLTDAEASLIYGPTPRNLLSAGAPSGLVHWSTLGDGCAIGAGNMPDLSAENRDGTAYNIEAGDFVADVPP